MERSDCIGIFLFTFSTKSYHQPATIFHIVCCNALIYWPFTPCLLKLSDIFSDPPWTTLRFLSLLSVISDVVLVCSDWFMSCVNFSLLFSVLNDSSLVSVGGVLVIMFIRFFQCCAWWHTISNSFLSSYSTLSPLSFSPVWSSNEIKGKNSITKASYNASDFMLEDRNRNDGKSANTKLKIAWTVRSCLYQGSSTFSGVTPIESVVISITLTLESTLMDKPTSLYNSWKIPVTLNNKNFLLEMCKVI